MLNISLLTDDQQNGIDRLYNHDHTLMVGKMGSGKTIVTLTALVELLADKVVSRVLVVAPLKVCKTVWRQEAANWEHTQHLNIALCTGTEKDRLHALNLNAEITLINFENLSWLFRKAGGKGMKNVFDGLVIDELSKLKSVGGTQFKSLRPRLTDFVWRVGLTGTPVSEDWAGLFGQMMVIDGGVTLGTRKDNFMSKYFFPTDYMRYNWELHDWAAAAMAKAIAPYVHTLPDYRSELPLCRYEVLSVTLPDNVREVYDTLQRDMVAEGVDAANAAVLSGKLQQVTSGFMYREDEETLLLSDFRITAAVAACKHGNTLLCYWYKEDYSRLLVALGDAGLRVGTLATGDLEATCASWNAGEYDVLLIHPRSAGHGLNLAQGGSRVLWFAPQWSRDLWEQTVARLWRRGQKNSVTVTTIEAVDTIDNLVALRVSDKAAFDRLFSEYFN